VNSKGETVKRPENCSGAPPHNAAMEATVSVKADAARVPTMVGWLSGCERPRRGGTRKRNDGRRLFRATDPRLC
jgi:hypothetical protein